MPLDSAPGYMWLGRETPSPSTRAAALSSNPKDAIGRTKTPMHLIPPSALVEMAKVMGLGAAKYGAYNWRDASVAATVYISAAQRHLAAFLDGENADLEPPNASHLAHAMACCAILMDAFATGNVVDDRPKPGVAAAMMRGEAPFRSVGEAMAWAKEQGLLHPTAPATLFCETVQQRGLPPSLTSVDGKHYRTVGEAAREAPRPFLWYIATPYAACPDGKPIGHSRAAMALAELQRRGVNAFSPIAHNHTAGLTLPEDHDYWMAIDRVFMDRCDGLLVMRQPGWKESRGVAEETQIFTNAGKPARSYYDPNLWTLGEETRVDGWDTIVSGLRATERQRAA